MVLFFEWHRTTMDQKSSSGLPMTGEDTGLGALALPLVGYLGKVQERAASLEYCPWCTSKGSTYALRSYRINLQESITLCTNPQCLFPLVSRSLEDVLASLVPVEPSVGNKRKKEGGELIGPVHKRLRLNESDSLGPQSITDDLMKEAGQGALNCVINGQHAAPKAGDERVNGYKDSPVVETPLQESLQYEDDILDQEPENATCTDVFASATRLTPAGLLQCSSEAALTSDAAEVALSHHRVSPDVSEAEDDVCQENSPPEALNRRCSLDSDQSSFAIDSNGINTPSPPHNEQTARTAKKPLTTDSITCKDLDSIKSKTECLSPTRITTQSDELVSSPNHLFWNNCDNLCWLDSMLIALVSCKSLRRSKPKDEPQQSSVWQLMRGYEDVCAATQLHQQTDRDGDVRVPYHVLQKANAELHTLRMSIFKLLQPKLHCKLGQEETPVFALPLLLKTDCWAEPLFQSTFHWEFKCSECKTATKERVIKTLPTFTKVLPDWRPLDAVHLAPCNVCCQKNQRRTLILESVAPVFGLHFVEGLPDNDVSIYTFSFKGKRYSITTVIQYNHQLKHFVTWICDSDGSWLEYDDLKHPDCKTHQKLPVLAQEMHVVFWEAEEDKESRTCSPSSTFSECPPSENEKNPCLSENGSTADNVLNFSTDQSLLTSHNDTDIICALSASEDTTITAGGDTSIGSTTLLDAFEGLSHDDIITLTLVELKDHSEMPPLNENKQTEDASAPSRDETLDSLPDSSSAVIQSELPSISISSDSADGSLCDPTFVPCGKRGRGRGRAAGRGRKVGRKTVTKVAAPKAAPQTSPTTSSEPSKEVISKPERDAASQNPPPVETTQRAAPMSATDTPQKNPNATMPPQNPHWSYMLSPVNQFQKSIAKVTPSKTPTSVPLRKLPPPIHSTPNPVRKQQRPVVIFPKPQLRTEDSDGLPLKAAEMYGGFGAKSSPSPLPSYALLKGKSKLSPPVTPSNQISLLNTTVVSDTPLCMPGATRLPEISSKKSSKLPPGLSETEALRYKLIKKLNAKKKKLAKLNEMLGHQGGASLRPDSTILGSPNTVTSSTYDSSICDDFLSDLLSPATTASNLSPDSTGFLELLASGQVEQIHCGVNAAGALPQMNNTDNFLEEFLSQAVTQSPSEMETDALSELFI
ncbi:SUMO-specific isopeptidase USPL1 isoform X1 [Gymnodraco acuticeps]|uniref:SUMO-specific isopeptidase USPL1 isoform X1 n=2 Tax=Gymnodraco acuticeps TaxID=8218 RepID=A0A6P8TX43_GYMAC|nr:SUMO-specific isopeptidase USPL1 isoform X1 [Gymnodraco acuticeps]